jgi:hypothetical protein
MDDYLARFAYLTVLKVPATFTIGLIPYNGVRFLFAESTFRRRRNGGVSMDRQRWLLRRQRRRVVVVGCGWRPPQSPLPLLLTC